MAYRNTIWAPLYGHIALSTDDIVAEPVTAFVNQAEKSPVSRVRSEGGATVIAFVEDPDGYKIELIEQKD